MRAALHVWTLLFALLLPGLAAAQPVGALTLSDAQKQEILAHNSETDVDAARAGLSGHAPRRAVHGEVGMAIGSHGLRSEYGTVAVPLGDSAGAVVSFENSRFGRAR